MQASGRKLLKKDVFGEILLDLSGPRPVIVRDSGCASFVARSIARHLLGREAAALTALEGGDGVPHLIEVDNASLKRTFIEGQPIYSDAPESVAYFHAAARLLRSLHRQGIAHNDLAKEANLLVDANGDPAFIDFQLAMISERRSKLFRILAREDLRHLLKHKRSYFPGELTAREREILSAPSWISRVWMATGKRVYLFVTRELLGWSDREGAADRIAPDTTPRRGDRES